MKYRFSKKLMALLIFVVMAFMLVGCDREKDDKKPLIVCSIFPEYDWLINVLGDRAGDFDIKLLLDKETDLHSYQPVAADIAAIIDSDVLIYVGGEADQWISEALSRNKIKKDKIVIKLLDELGENALSEELIEGMQHDVFDRNHDEEELDEHIWLSVENAIIASRVIADKIMEKYPEKDGIKASAEKYIGELTDLNQKYFEFSKVVGDDYIIVADRFPFIYLAKSLGLKYYAAFSGCSADSEASFKTVTFLADKLENAKIKNMFVLENSDTKLAKTISDTANVSAGRVYVLDSMQYITDRSRQSDYSYIKAMEYNLDILGKAFAGR